MVVLVVSWTAKPGKAEEVAQRHQNELARFLVYEQYADDAALEAHRTTKHFLEIARGALPKVADRVDANLYTPL